MTERLEVHSIIWATFSDSRVYTRHTHAHNFYYYCTSARLQNRKTLEIQKIQISTTAYFKYLCKNVAKFIQKYSRDNKNLTEVQILSCYNRNFITIMDLPFRVHSYSIHKYFVKCDG